MRAGSYACTHTQRATQEDFYSQACLCSWAFREPTLLSLPLSSLGLRSEPGPVPRAVSNLCVRPSCSLDGKGKETMPSDFWDHLKEQLSSVPPDFSCALELLKEVKEVSGLLCL